MGKRADEALELGPDGLRQYLLAHHSLYLEVGGKLYYLTDVNEHAWRAQDTEVLNDKGHYTDCSELVQTVDEFLALPLIDGKPLPELAGEGTFCASVK